MDKNSLIDWKNSRVYIIILFLFFPFSQESICQVQKESIECEDVFIHTDKSIYTPGEDIWFKAYVLNDEDHLPSITSKVLFVSLIDKDNMLLFSEKFPIHYGSVNGDIHIPDTLKDGTYQIVACTEKLKQLPPEYWYYSNINIGYSAINLLKILYAQDVSKIADSLIFGEITCRSSTGYPIAGVEVECAIESVNKKLNLKKLTSDTLGKAFLKWRIPDKLMDKDITLTIKARHANKEQEMRMNIPLGKQGLDIRFYPEGGSLIQGLKNRVAFKVVDSYGLPLSIKGTLLNQDGRKVQQIKTLHDGLGLFTFVPRPNESYYVSLQSPIKVDTLYAVPKSIESGVALSVTQSEQSTMSVSISVSNDLVGKEVRLALSNGLTNETLFESIIKKENRIKISTSAYPIGISTLTLFSENKPLAERLVFLNKNKKMQVLIETDKESYNPRDKVHMLVTTLDFEGNPTAANLSLSVSEENKNVSSQTDILSQLLLSPKLNGARGDLSYYLENSPRADSSLNLLLMVHGWRRIGLIEEYSKAILDSKSISGIKGYVYIKKKIPAVKATVQLINADTWNMVTTETDDQGFFLIPTLDYLAIAQNRKLLINAIYPDQDKKLTITFIKEMDEVLFQNNLVDQQISDVHNLPKNTPIDSLKKFESYLSLFEPSELIEEIIVTGKRIKPALTHEEMREQVFSIRKKTSKQMVSHTFASTTPITSGQDLSFLEVIRKVSPPFQIRNGKIIYRGIKAIKESNEMGALVVVNGIPMGSDITTLSSTINPMDIKEISVNTSPGAALKYSKSGNGVIEITLYDGRKETPKPVLNENDMLVIKGYKISREFNAPDYTPSINSSFEKSDIRTTLYWNPNLIIGNEGKHRMSFFVGDKKTKFVCRILGVNDMGLIGNSSINIRTK